MSKANQKMRKQLEGLSEDILTCRPLDSYKAILQFLENPPPWRTLCQGLTPHSNCVVSNMDNIKGYQLKDIMLGTVSDYCHFDPDSDDPGRDDEKQYKTLVCHDMANGYHDDCHIDGTVNYDQYTFYNWAGIDIFCYFSHHLITIPPLAWINVAHAHGVKIIGTIITEWGEGTSFWDKVLESEAKYQEFASAVVAIAKTLKLDGWLLNIENKVTQPDVLLEFVKHLHQLMHSELVDPVLIWYDSVTIKGKLHWQNKLNDMNKPFFDACDGFFVNYSWSVEDVESSVMAAGSRVTDLYIGIDIWGRNFYCGGQFNSYEAIKVAYNEGCSLAIFAPAWTHEAMTTDVEDPNFVVNGEKLSKMLKWELRDRALWASIWPYVHTRVPCHLPFQTSFCRGQGKKRWQYGEVISPGPWYNLRYQQYQPNSRLSQHGYILNPFESKKESKTTVIKDEEPASIVKLPSQTEITEEEEEKADGEDDSMKPEGEEEDSALQLKVVDSLERIEHGPTQTPSQSAKPKSNLKTTTHSTDNKPIPVPGSEPVPVPVSAAKPILKKTFLQKILGIFKSKPKKLKDEQKKEKYYGNEKAVAYTKVDHLLAGTSSAKSNPEASNVTEKILPKTEARVKEASVMAKTIAANKKPSDALDSDGETLKIKSSNSDLKASTMRGASMITTSIYLNLRQPDVKTRWVLTYKHRERECFQLYLDDAFIGGACLRVNASDSENPLHRTSRLFHCDFKCDHMLIVCVVTKTMRNYRDQCLNVRLKMKNAANQDLTVVLLGRNLELPTNLSSNSVGIHYAYPLYSEKQKEFGILREYLLINEPGFYVPIDNFYGWEIRYYKVQVPGSRVIQINCRTELPQGGILLGHLGICHWQP